MANLIQLPDIVDEVEVYKNAFSVISPEARTNLVINPSVERGTTGYTVSDGILLRVSTQQRRGSYSLCTNGGIGLFSISTYYTLPTNLLADTYYVFSLDLLGNPGGRYRLHVHSPAPIARIYSGEWFDNKPYWIRPFIVFQSAGAAAHVLEIEADHTVDFSKFYTDGWQLEVGTYPTSYIDGDLEGFVHGQKAYGWNGIRHASTSFRILDTTHGGREVSITEAGLIVSGVVGGGYYPVKNTITAMNTGGGSYDASTPDSRALSLLSRLAIGAVTPSITSRVRSTIEQLFSINQTKYTQPVVLKYHPTNECGERAGVDTRTAVVYNDGMQGEDTNMTAEDMSIDLIAPDFAIPEDGDDGQELNYRHNITLGYSFGYFDSSWQTMGGGADGRVYVIKYNPYNGLVYFGGAFANIGGVPAVRIASYDPLTGVFTALGLGCDNTVNDIDFDNNGNLIVVGAFLNAGGAANPYHAIWNITTNAWVSTGIGTSGGTIYNCAVVRGYTNVAIKISVMVNTGGANYDLVKTGTVNTAGWAVELNGVFAAGAPTASRLIRGYDPLATTADKMGFYAAVSFPDGLGNTYARVRRRTGGYPLIGEFVTTGAAASITIACMAMDEQGNLYVGGTFDTCNTTGTLMNLVAKYNQVSWTGLGNSLQGGATETVNSLKWANGKLYAGGNFLTSGVVPIGIPIAVFDGSIWTGVFGVATLPGTPSIDEIEMTPESYHWKTFVGFDGTGAAILPGEFTVNGDVDNCYPVFEYRGPGDVKLVKNNTHEQEMLIDIENIAPTETVKIEFSPNDFRVYSDVRGFLPYAVQPGADFNLQVMGGDNILSAFVENYWYETGDTANQLTDWQNVIGISGAVREFTPDDQPFSAALTVTTYTATDHGRVRVYIEDMGAGARRVRIYNLLPTGAAVGSLIGHTANYAAPGVQAIVPDASIYGPGLSGTITIGAIGAATQGIYVTYGVMQVKWVNRYRSIYQVQS